MVTASNSGDVLFFIPDMGGYTRFVTETEVSHSQHIIKELLELLVDANELDLAVSEFEGDAVLFFRTGAPPTLSELVTQARRMFVDFHSHLRQLELLRVCQCGACSRASDITLKFVVHRGPARTMEVKGHSKFIGKSIIVAHRLLKNSVAETEYLLITQETLDQLRDGAETVVPFARGSSTYDELGEISFRHHSMAAYLTEARVAPLRRPVTLPTP
jgi:hypothetical protein